MTPIEELIEMYEKFKGLLGGVSIESVIEHLKRAKDKETQMLDQLKAKHKEDVIKAFVDGVEGERSWYIHKLPERAEQYYNETFKQ